MNKLKSKEFWLSILERGIKTFCEAMLATIGVSWGTVGLTDIDWLNCLSISAVAVIISVLTNLATLDTKE